MKNSFILPVFLFFMSVSNVLRASSILASSFGFNPSDATAALQGSINSGNDTVIIDLQASDWITQPLFIDSIQNLVVIFEPGVQLVAKSGAFPGLNDNLLRIRSCSHITLVGYGAVMRMIKGEYTSGEWRHCLSIINSSDIQVYGLELNDSGGDGLYIADASAAGPNTYCRKIHIKNCRMNNNKRQGLSIISADSVLIEHCEMTNTNGASPEAGIDFEPDLPSQRITNLVLKNCVLTGNNGSGILVNSKYMDGTSVPVSITIDNCYLAGNLDSQLYLNSDTIETSGTVTVNNTLIENSAFPGVYLNKSATDFMLLMNDCVLKNVADTSFSFFSPITMQTFPYIQNTTEYGGATFSNCLIEFPQNRPYLQCVDLGLPPGSADISGHFTIVNPFGVAPTFGSSPANILVTENYHTNFPLQMVTVSTSDPDAFESTGDMAGFEISRTGTDSFPLAVTYTVNGPAINRTDYSLLPGFLVIPSFSSTASDSLEAIADQVSEPTEETRLHFGNNSSYQVTGPDSLTLFIDPVPAVIQEQELPGDVWLGPSPVSDWLMIRSTRPMDFITIYTADGRTVRLEHCSNQRHIRINLEDLPPGFYLMDIHLRNTILSKKIIRR